MKKSEFVGVRLKPTELKIIKERVEEEKIDKSTAIRQLLELGIRQYRLEKAVQLYRTGKVSIGKAAEIAGLSVSEMMDVLVERGVPSNLTVEDFREGLKNLEKAFKTKFR